MNMLPGGAKIDKACVEYCPMLRNLAEQANTAKSTADRLQTDALEDTQNTWHTVYKLAGEFGRRESIPKIYSDLIDDPETAEQFAALAAPFFSDSTPEELEEFFTDSRKKASETIETVFAPVWQSHEQRRQLIGAACLQGPQVALMTVDSKQHNDPRQDIEQAIVMCSSPEVAATKPIDANNTERLSHLIERARALGRATRAISNSPAARVATETLLGAFGRPPKSERDASDK